MTGRVAFLADAMLGRLARWLRLAGYDTWYDSKAPDDELARLARLTGRVLLTRDRELTRRRGLRSFLVEPDEVQEQLLTVVEAFPPPRGETACARCARCNALLAEVDKCEVEGLVPTYVWVNHERFRRCPGCGRVYWAGTHWGEIESVLAAAFGELS